MFLLRAVKTHIKIIVFLSRKRIYISFKNYSSGAIDHDWHLAGIVTSVALHADAPENPRESFFSGQTYATLKERVFSPSNPSRHATEICEQIQERNGSEISEDEILCILTDGGSDHNVRKISVEVLNLLL